MLRLALFTALLLGGSLLFETMGVVSSDVAWLIAAAMASLLLFCLPETGKARDPKDLIFGFVSAICVYGIFVKVRPWLAEDLGRVMATIVSIVLLLAFGAGFLLLSPMKRVSAGDNRNSGSGLS